MSKEKNFEEYTVEELIEVLQQCPKDYKVALNMIYGKKHIKHEIDIVGIDHESNEVTLFGNW